MDFNTLADTATITKTIDALKGRGFDAEIVQTGAEALERVKALIPAGVSIMNGSSTTLNQIGFVDYLKEGTHGWNNLHDAILAEKDPDKQAALRAQSVISDYFVYGVHAISAEGHLVFGNASGSAFGPLSFTAKNLVLVAGVNKIVPTLDNAFARIREHVFPLEDQRMKSTSGMGSIVAKLLVLEHEPAFMGRTVRIVLINETLGF